MRTEPSDHRLLDLKGLGLDLGSNSPNNDAVRAQTLLESLPDGLTEERVREQLTRILTSETFQRAERLSRFLRYTVEQSLAGQDTTLKEYSIGLHVFDKPETFDTRVDPIVRVEAGRLRAKIRDYYDNEGSKDLIWLGLQKRGYRPVFQWRSFESPQQVSAQAEVVVPLATPVVAAQAPGVAADGIPRPAISDARTVAVLPFEDLSPEKTQEYFCDGITQEIVNALAKTDGLSVVARTSAAQFKGKPEDVREIARQLQVGRVLEGSVQKIGQLVRISAHLVDALTGFDCWAETYDRPLDDVLAIQDEISQKIAEALHAKAESALAEAATVG
jgi:serine/threonine-protein kinase